MLVDGKIRILFNDSKEGLFNYTIEWMSNYEIDLKANALLMLIMQQDMNILSPYVCFSSQSHVEYKQLIQPER